MGKKYNNILIANHNKTYVGNIEVITGKIKIKKSQSSQYNLVALPFFVDSHTHGGYDFSFNDLTKKENNFKKYEQKLANEGVGLVIASLVSTTSKKIEKILQKIIALKSNYILDFHIEGPFISSEKKGAHEAKLIRPLTEEFLVKLRLIKGELPMVITIAPEIKGHLQLINKYQNDFIFSIGHSNASLEFTEQAIKAGAKKITHLYNAMSGYNHRNPGIINALFKYPQSLLIEMITDGKHIDAEVLKWTYNLIKAENIAVITDSVSAKKSKNKTFMLGNLKCETKGNCCYIAGTNTLAGSAASYNLVLKTFKKITKAKWEDIVKVSSYNILKSYNLEHKYYLENDKEANFVIINQKFEIVAFYKDGQQIKKKEDKWVI